MAMIRGKIYWAKILGEPQPGYDPGKTEWTFDISIDEHNRGILEELDMLDKIKQEKKPSDRGDFVQFKRSGTKRDPANPSLSVPAKPIEVVSNVRTPDGKGWEPWDRDVLIGNGSVANVMFAINEGEYRGKPYRKLSPIKVQIVEHVELEPREDFPGDDDGFEDS